MNLSEIMRFFTFCILLFGLTSGVLGQGKRRVLRVRKTGEFGRRIAPISTFYEPPKRMIRISDQFLQATETRSSPKVVGVRKPSQKLELPSFSQPEQDSIAEETGDSLQGYAYPDPQAQGGDYAFNAMKIRHPALSEANEPPLDEEQRVVDPPTNVIPEREAEFSHSPKPLGAETQENIDAQNQSPRAAAPPKPVRTSPEASDNPAQCSEHDHDCWPHGYQGEIPGEAGTDYPILSEIVDTPFDCNNVQHSGYYADADEQARCQIFHVCLKGNAYRKTQKWSFLCPNGTVFSQGDFVCVWWTGAPECNSGLVDELSLRNAELGWDNLTETESSSPNNFDVRSAMSSLFNTNLQTSSSDSRLKNTLPAPTTTRRPPVQASRNAIPYRVPVKVNSGMGARTKLKEVSGNGIQSPPDSEYTGEESETYETSLRHQSEARRKTKTASALHKSESEAYEQKSVSDSVAPFVVHRNPVETDNEDLQSIPQGPYDGEGPVPEVVMMPTQQKNPDGTEGYAEVPVMMNAGYRYPAPTSTSGPEYLPPRKEFVPQSTTEAPTTTTQFATEESFESEGYQYPNPSTEGPVGSEIKETVTEEEGYNYPVPSTTEQEGYSYPNPTTEAPYREEEVQVSSQNPVSEEVEGGYGYESTPAPETTANNQEQSKVQSTSEDPSGTYLPPQGGYDSPRSSAALQAAADVLSLPRESGDDLENKLALAVTSNPDSEIMDYTDPADPSTVDTNEIAAEGGYSDKAATPEYHIPTPSSTSTGATTGDHLDSDDKVNEILKEIQNGGAEVRDENGKKLDFAELQKLIMSTPNGLLSLQKADDSTTTDSSPPASTEATVDPVDDGTTSEELAKPVLETVQPIVDEPSTRYLPQQNYFTNNRVVNVKHPGFEISAPAKEHEIHSIQQNTVEQNSGNFNNGYNSYQTEVQRNTNYQQPQPQYVQNFAPVQNTQAPQLFFLPPVREAQSIPVQQQQQFITQQPQSPAPEYVRPSVPQPEQYYQQQRQQFTPNTNTNAQPENYFQSQRTQPQTPHPQISQQEQYYQTQPQQPQTQPQQLQQHQPTYFQQDRQPQQQVPQQAPQYLPPPPSTSQSQAYNPPPTQFRNLVPPPRDLTNNIQLQQSYSLPVPQASAGSRQLTTPLDIKIVPALLVDQHTRIENPDGTAHKEVQQRPQSNTRSYQSPTNFENNPFRQFSQQNSGYLPHGAQTEHVAVKVAPPRLNAFTLADALPKYEPFTEEDSRPADTTQFMQYHQGDRRKLQPNVRAQAAQAAQSPSRQPVSFRRNERHFIGSEPRGYLGLPSNDQSLVSNLYPGRDRSLGVKLTYN